MTDPLDHVTITADGKDVLVIVGGEVARYDWHKVRDVKRQLEVAYREARPDDIHERADDLDRSRNQP